MLFQTPVSTFNTLILYWCKTNRKTKLHFKAHFGNRRVFEIFIYSKELSLCNPIISGKKQSNHYKPIGVYLYVASVISQHSFSIHTIGKLVGLNASSRFKAIV